VSLSNVPIHLFDAGVGLLMGMINHDFAHRRDKYNHFTGNTSQVITSQEIHRRKYIAGNHLTGNTSQEIHRR
jgi:hypothetical protein